MKMCFGVALSNLVHFKTYFYVSCSFIFVIVLMSACQIYFFYNWVALMNHRQTTVILMLVFVGQENKRVNLMAKI